MKRNFKLIMGLGNPGKEYENTYHSIGASFVDFLKSAEIIDYKKIMKTTVFMNESGSFVAKAIKQKNTRPDELLIVHDDSDIDLGKYKLGLGRNSAGHKGVESIIKKLKTNQFWRLRIGIRKNIEKSGKQKRLKAGDFVLKKISPTDKSIFDSVFEEIINKEFRN